jgi:MFS family permease
MPAIIGKYKIALSSAGLTMSVFSFVGLVLAMPTGLLLKKYGIKVVGMLGMTCGLAGCVVDALANSFSMFLAGRALQGICFGLIAMVGMATASLWFPRQKVSLAMGIVGTCVGVGGFTAMAATPRIVAATGPTGVWWISAVLSAVALLAVAILVKMPPWVLAAAAAAKDAGTPPNTSEAYKNRNIWTLTLAYCMFYIPVGSLMTFYITYLKQARGMSLKQAGFVSSLMMVGLLVGGPLGGIVLAKIRHLKLSLIAVGCAIIVLSATSFLVTGPLIPIWAFVFGVIGLGFMRVICMSAIPGIMEKPELIGVGIGIYMQGATTAGIIAPPALGAIVQHSSWVMGGYALIPVVIIGIFFTWLTKFAE